MMLNMKRHTHYIAQGWAVLQDWGQRSVVEAGRSECTGGYGTKVTMGICDGVNASGRKAKTIRKDTNEQTKAYTPIVHRYTLQRPRQEGGEGRREGGKYPTGKSEIERTSRKRKARRVEREPDRRRE